MFDRYRVTIMRGDLKGYRDVDRYAPLRILAAIWSNFLLCLVLLLPFALIGLLSAPRDGGTATTAIYLLSVLASTTATYLTSLVATINGLAFTSPNWLFAWKELPVLLWRERRQVLRRWLPAVTVPLAITVFYWFLQHRVPTALNPQTLWIGNNFISSVFAISVGYRIFRQNLTVLDTFRRIEPKPRKKRFGQLKDTPISTMGDGVLISPLVQAVAVMAITGSTMGSMDQTGLNGSEWALLFILSHACAQAVWAILYRLLDAFKPFGERGKLSVLRHGDGTKIASRTEVNKQVETVI